MTIRREMHSAAARAGLSAGDQARLTVQFVMDRQVAGGGFSGRSDRADLYYTVFALEVLAAMPGGKIPPTVEGYLRGFDGGDGLDFVHLTCLGRCWTIVSPIGPPPTVRDEILTRLAAFRCADGGFSQSVGSDRGSAYGAFLALGAWQDMRAEMPRISALADSVEALASADGGFANAPGMEIGSVPATAAALVLLRHLNRTPPEGAVRWLEARGEADGGFRAMPLAPAPDLLSTATALHALTTAGRSLDAIRQSCLNFVEGLRTRRGGFAGHWADTDGDCEYTFYGLLALGHLAR